MARTNAVAFARSLHRLAQTVPAAERLAVLAAAEAAKKTISTTARTRGWKPTDRWITVDPQPGPRATVTLRGARAYWAERGTKPHDIQPRRGRAILTPEGPRAHARHPGARPRPFWRAGVAASPRAMRPAYAVVFGGELIRRAR